MEVTKTLDHRVWELVEVSEVGQRRAKGAPTLGVLVVGLPGEPGLRGSELLRLKELGFEFPGQRHGVIHKASSNGPMVLLARVEGPVIVGIHSGSPNTNAAHQQSKTAQAISSGPYTNQTGTLVNTMVYYDEASTRFDHHFEGWSVWLDLEERDDENVAQLRCLMDQMRCTAFQKEASKHEFPLHMTLLYNFDLIVPDDDCLSEEEAAHRLLIHCSKRIRQTAPAATDVQLQPKEWFTLDYPKSADNGRGFGAAVGLLILEKTPEPRLRTTAIAPNVENRDRPLAKGRASTEWCSAACQEPLCLVDTRADMRMVPSVNHFPWFVCRLNGNTMH